MKRKRVVRIMVAGLLLAALLVAMRLLPLGGWIASFQAWVQGLGPLGYAVYILAYVVFCVLGLPASPLTFGAGAIFGFVGGTIVVVIGATLGATLSFLLARTVMRRRIEGMTAQNAKFRALDRAITREGGRIVFLVRLAPVFPFAYINFAFGLTGVRTLTYIVATFLGIIPLTLAFVYISATAAQAATADMSQARLIINIVGGAFALVATAFVTRVATRAIKKAGVDDSTENGETPVSPARPH
ncbi:MAG: TVP38/TMEM64 family protein [Acidobacteriota bacterium]